MDSETRTLLNEANMVWDRVSADCERITHAMALVPIDHPLHAKLNDDLKNAQAVRREAGDRHAALLKRSFDEFDAEHPAAFDGDIDGVF